jgi:hypothetical protein
MERKEIKPARPSRTWVAQPDVAGFLRFLQWLAASSQRERDDAKKHVTRDLAALDGDDHATSLVMYRMAMERSAIQAS